MGAPASECEGLEVLSIHFVTDDVGKYFNFDQARTEENWQHQFEDREDFTVVCERTGETVEVTIWNEANGGANDEWIGYARGRKTSGAAEGDWEVGDCLTLAAPTE